VKRLFVTLNKYLPLRSKTRSDLSRISLYINFIVKTNHILLAFCFALLTAWSGAKAYAGGGGEGAKADPIDAVIHHIGDAHEFHIIGDIHLPLPCIAYSSDNGFFFAMSSAFKHGTHAIDGFMMHHGTLYRIKDFAAKGEVDLNEPVPHHGGTGHNGQTVDKDGVHGGGDDKSNLHGAQVTTSKNADGKEVLFLDYKGTKYELISSSSIQGLSTWYDFSITKNVFAMFLGFLILFIIFRNVANAYKVRKGQAPKGLQSLIEVVIVFMREEVAKPSIGVKWEKYFPFILSLFFFILVNNLLGLIPFFPGSANVTGNLGTTIVLALFTFFVVNLSGNKHYWLHVFWMPGVPFFVKLILTPIEVLGLFLKPITLFIRLFANITAGHIIILSLVSLIFIFNDNNIMGGGPTGIGLALPFVFALNFLELLVSFIQAFLFALLTAIYIGSAVEEHHHEEHAADGHH
jgi:F-type H+-transporting ATPase subunit a